MMATIKHTGGAVKKDEFLGNYVELENMLTKLRMTNSMLLHVF